jgi:hypothetical protein
MNDKEDVRRGEILDETSSKKVSSNPSGSISILNVCL